MNRVPGEAQRAKGESEKAASQKLSAYYVSHCMMVVSIYAVTRTLQHLKHHVIMPELHCTCASMPVQAFTVDSYCRSGC